VLISAILLAIGVRTVVHNVAQGNKFWTIAFWYEDPTSESLEQARKRAAVADIECIELEPPVTSPMV
jgi:hypothetical protein